MINNDRIVYILDFSKEVCVITLYPIIYENFKKSKEEVSLYDFGLKKITLTKNNSLHNFYFKHEVKPMKAVLELNNIDNWKNFISFPNNFIIKEFIIVTDLKYKIKELILKNAWHPNAYDSETRIIYKPNRDPPKNQFLCLPSIVIGYYLDNDAAKFLIEKISTHNYRYSYWIDTSKIKLRN